jgi:hypothetical protein
MCEQHLLLLVWMFACETETVGRRCSQAVELRERSHRHRLWKSGAAWVMLWAAPLLHSLVLFVVREEVVMVRPW